MGLGVKKFKIGYLTLGRGPIYEDETGQLRDDLSRLWCPCGKPATVMRPNNYPPYHFLCKGCDVK